MNMDSLKCEIHDNDKFYYYGIADIIKLTEIVLNDDWEGIILHTGERELTLSRKTLLKHYNSLRLDCYDFELINASKYVFKVI